MSTEEYADIFKALGSEQRLKLFLMIVKNCCGTTDGYDRAFTKACECLDLSRSTVSHHLKELQNAGLVVCEREGQSFRCRVNEKTVQKIKDLLS